MSEIGNWAKSGILIVGIYFKENVPNAANDARRWLKDTLINQLINKLDYGNREFIIPLEYALTRYIPYVKEKENQKSKHKRPPGRAKGGEYKYLIQNVDEEFYKALFEILNENQKRIKWFGEYYVMVAKRVRKYE